VADYPFTTIEPVLGTLDGDDRQLVIADIPGLIEGASAGAGLGHEFLAHLERTRLLVHVLELRPLDGSDPVANHATVEHELELHDPRLAATPRILALSKADLLDAASAAAVRDHWTRRLGSEVPVILSSATSSVRASWCTCSTCSPSTALTLSPTMVRSSASSSFTTQRSPRLHGCWRYRRPTCWRLRTPRRLATAGRSGSDRECR
jgi:GTPase involved in cell partitioning and DNA repair